MAQYAYTGALACQPGHPGTLPPMAYYPDLDPDNPKSVPRSSKFQYSIYPYSVNKAGIVRRTADISHPKRRIVGDSEKMTTYDHDYSFGKLRRGIYINHLEFPIFFNY